jgi:hypothetical protein
VSYVVLDGVDGNAWGAHGRAGSGGSARRGGVRIERPLGFTIPYTHKGRTHQAMRAAKADTARDLWLPAVNNDERWGRWGFCEGDDPTRAKLDIGAAADALREGVGQ